MIPRFTISYALCLNWSCGCRSWRLNNHHFKTAHWAVHLTPLAALSCSLKEGSLWYFTFEKMQLEFKETWFLTVRRFNASLKLKPLKSLPSVGNSAQKLESFLFTLQRKTLTKFHTMTPAWICAISLLAADMEVNRHTAENLCYEISVVIQGFSQKDTGQAKVYLKLQIMFANLCLQILRSAFSEA